MTNLKELINQSKEKLGLNLSDEDLFNTLFEMNRYFDKNFHEQLRNKIAFEGKHFNQHEKNILRKVYYYGFNDESPEEVKQLAINFASYEATSEDKSNVLAEFLNRCREYNENKIISSFKQRLKKESAHSDNVSSWLEYYNDKRNKNFDFSCFILNYGPEDFKKDNYDINNIFKVISNIYSKLENYRHFIFYVKAPLTDLNDEDVTWQILYKVGIYCENFKKFKDKFPAFKKEKNIKQLASFIESRFDVSEEKSQIIASDFYSCISTGFKFEDCLVNKEHKIIAIFKKIELDRSPVPCPICMSTEQRGNSFPELFLRSYECANPNCAARSKSGRGKRFDEFGVYRYLKVVENDSKNKISDDLFTKWRRDVFQESNVYEMLFKYYAWAGEKICIYSLKDLKEEKCYDRICFQYEMNTTEPTAFTKYSDLNIVKLFKQLDDLKIKFCNDNSTKNKLEKEIEIFNLDSAKGLFNLEPNEISTAMTSPPYYNAREYSQWSNLILYLIDMFINAKAVNYAMSNNGYYLYNIGDIVGEDNVYVSSLMSKRRLPLGFLSSLIFEQAKFNLVGNIIWDKGEVQSKRNSTINRYSGYVKCINCYEHIFIFKKGRETKLLSDIKQISPVIKINSKGQNTYGHTAPYPLDLVELLRPFIKKDGYILDPYLGSGTTVKWCKKNGFKAIGYELNEDYFNLAKENIK